MEVWAAGAVKHRRVAYVNGTIEGFPSATMKSFGTFKEPWFNTILAPASKARVPSPAALFGYFDFGFNAQDSEASAD
ncbi:hypothetical protein MGG_18074 [Pyricularia oryzae 70-15]|uniref:Uncharacterized protein n=1 Tax=Pyricularia oryzae (strain 70-15 / ATCC MYA-4617 / FGSC 8958) TaxID=242507 RepID=G4NKZ6_PYRO7|nr:uncharacterized protein MGG_18074 [Pyricularia oryzae 70-15]EHA46688.1 hypothetical protein MGG_18074 [Pyricularia oryzae 70-15]